jgi:hypothetical protein
MGEIIPQVATTVAALTSGAGHYLVQREGGRCGRRRSGLRLYASPADALADPSPSWGPWCPTRLLRARGPAAGGAAEAGDRVALGADQGGSMSNVIRPQAWQTAGSNTLAAPAPAQPKPMNEEIANGSPQKGSEQVHSRRQIF